MTVGVLVNPAARRNRTRKSPLKSIAATQAEVLYEELDDFSKLPDALEQFVQANAPAILVSGGDGTVQAVQTWLAENVAHDRLPRLAILPGGTTNMDAADIGVQNPNSHSVLERLMSPEYCRRSTHVKRRNTVRIDNPAGKPPQHGMFFGIGAIHRAAVMCQTDIHALGLTGELASGLTLLRALFRTLFLGNKGHRTRPHLPADFHDRDGGFADLRDRRSAVRPGDHAAPARAGHTAVLEPV